MRTIIAVTFLSLILAIPGPPVAAQNAPATFLFLLENGGSPTATIRVFSVNTSTGAITEVIGSPFNAGLNPQYLALDPTGRFLFVANTVSNDITAFSVDPAAGTLSELPGSPNSVGGTPQAMAIDPTGRFLYVAASNGQGESVYEFTIDGVSGVLSAVPGASLQGIFATSIAFDPLANYAYLSTGSPGPGLANPILVCSIDFTTGALTPIGQGQPAAGGSNVMAVSPNGALLYSVDTRTSHLDAFAVGAEGAQMVESPGSPYAIPLNALSLVVHPSGNFVYVVNENQPYANAPSQSEGGVSAFAINAGTGALTPILGSPFAAGINPLSVVVDPAGRLAYTTSTSYLSVSMNFAQIMGFSIDTSTGILTPLSAASWTDTIQSNGEQLAISQAPATVSSPTPMISSLSPPSTSATAVAFTLQVNGANFVPGATVYFGGQARSTTFVSPTQLNASIAATDIDNGGTSVVFVFNPAPGGGASTSVEFQVSNPVPAISSIAPTSIVAGGPATTVEVLGSGFVTSSAVSFNGTTLPTSYASPTILTAQISMNQIAGPGTVSISVTNPENGVTGAGGISNAATLTITPSNAQQPSVSSVSPTGAAAGGAGFTLTVNGSGFVQGSLVSFQLINVATTFVSSSQLTAFILPSAISTPGNPYVIVTNPNGFASAQINFAITNPQPGGGMVTPPSVPAGSYALTLTVTGTNFTQASVVFVNGSARVTTFVSSTSLFVTLLSSDLDQAGTLNITVTNPPPGGGTTPAIGFLVMDYSLNPPSSVRPVTAGDTATLSLTLDPANGVPFNYPVTLSVSGLPFGASASFAPSVPITPGALPQGVVLTVATSPHTAASMVRLPNGFNPREPLGWAVITALAGIALVGLMLRRPGERAGAFAPVCLLLLCVMTATCLVGCGVTGSGSGSASGTGMPPSVQLNPTTGTPAGTYQLSVIGISGGIKHTATVPLTIV